MKLAILLILLFFPFLVSGGNINSFGPSPGFFKIQEALDYAEDRLIRDRAIDALDAFERLRYLVAIDPRITAISDTPELGKQLDVFRANVDSGALLRDLKNAKLQQELSTLQRGGSLGKVELSLPWPFCEVFNDCL